MYMPDLWGCHKCAQNLPHVLQAKGVACNVVNFLQLKFWDKSTKTATILSHENVLPYDISRYLCISRYLFQTCYLVTFIDILLEPFLHMVAHSITHYSTFWKSDWFLCYLLDLEYEAEEEVAPTPSPGYSNSCVEVWHESCRTGWGKKFKQDSKQCFPPLSSSQVCTQSEWVVLGDVPYFHLHSCIWLVHSP